MAPIAANGSRRPAAHSRRPQGPAPTRTIVAALRRTYQADPRAFTVGAILQLVGALSPVALVLVGRYLLEALTPADGHIQASRLIAPVLVLAVVTAVTVAAGNVQQLQQRVLGEQVATRAWQRVLDITSRVGMSSYEDSTFYDQLQRIKTSAFTQNVAVTTATFGMIGGLIGLVGLLAALASIEPLLIPILLVAGVPSLLISRRTSSLEFRFLTAGTPVFRAREYLRQTLTGRDEAKEIRVFAAEQALRERHDARSADYLTLLRGHVAKRRVYALADVTISSIFLALTLGFVVWELSDGRIALGSAAAAILAVRFVSSALSQLLRSVGSLFESSAFLADMEMFITARRADLEFPASSPEGIGPLRSALELRAISFTYPGSRAAVVRDVDLCIEAGQIVALVGENGSGKTTLAKLVAGLYRPTGGQILWDGQDTADVRPADVRRQISVIFQDFVRYQLSALDNVGLGEPAKAADLDAARNAAEQAGALDFITALPREWHTVLSREFSDGHDLSGGQWQRTALARALRKPSSLVVLDEPTAALDPRSEAALFSDVKRTLRGRAGLLISHRFSSVRLADYIYVLQAGRVVEHGTHDALVGRGGLYAELFRAQADAYL